MRSKKAVLNVVISLLFELVTIISAFLLPRLVLNSFGSATNGITQAVSQFIGYISLIAAGVGSVTVASLYRPIANKDIGKVSSIIKATEIFMRKVSRIFIGGLIVFAIVFPIFVIEEFDYFFSLSLVIILGIGTFGNYYFGITYRMVLNADQKQYIFKIVKIIVLIIHTTVAVILINLGATIHIVKLASSLIFLINPVFVYIYVRKVYKLDKFAKPDFTAIKQRWDAFAHQIANFVNNNTDLIILIIFTNSREVSVYSVYYLIFNGIRALVLSMITGTTSAFGNMFAKGEIKTVEKNLKLYEFLLHSISVIIYTSMAILITSFIDLYVKGVTDVNYHRPLFGYIISAIGFFVAVRIPYQAVTNAAGHFKQTRNGAIVEVILNITISLVLVIPLGMIGLAIGTLSATIFRTIQYGLYSSRNIVKRSTWIIIRRYFISILNVVSILIVSFLLPQKIVNNYYDWIFNGLIITGVGVIITLIYSFIFYSQDLHNMKHFILRVLKR